MVSVAGECFDNFERLVSSRNIKFEEAQVEIDDVEAIFDYLEERRDILIRRLRDLVRFPSVSSQPGRWRNTREMAEYLADVLARFKLKCNLVPIVSEPEEDEHLFLVLAETEVDPSKRTLCFYCCYDVHRETNRDFWYGDPFSVTLNYNETEITGKGVSFSKGPLLCVVNAIGAYQRLGIDMPVNVKLVLDPLGTSDDDRTSKFLRKSRQNFFDGVDFACLCTGNWLGNKPCIFHGSRGICYFSVEITGPSKDLHSGHYGGLINEPMADLVFMLNRLVNKYGVLLVDQIYDDVRPVTKEIKKSLSKLDFNVYDFKESIGAFRLLVKENKISLLANRFLMPSLSIHGIEGAHSAYGSANRIPGKVVGKFSINIVPDMTPSNVKKKVFDYLGRIWQQRRSFNKIRVQMTVGKPAWYTNRENVSCAAANTAVGRVYGQEADMIVSPSRVKMAKTLQKIAKSPVIMMPVSRADDIADSGPEKMSVDGYVDGAKLYAVYMLVLGSLSPKIVPVLEAAQCTCKLLESPGECICDSVMPPADREVDFGENGETAFPFDVVLPESVRTLPVTDRLHEYNVQAQRKMNDLNELYRDLGKVQELETTASTNGLAKCLLADSGFVALDDFGIDRAPSIESLGAGMSALLKTVYPRSAGLYLPDEPSSEYFFVSVESMDRPRSKAGVEPGSRECEK